MAKKRDFNHQSIKTKIESEASKMINEQPTPAPMPIQPQDEIDKLTIKLVKVANLGALMMLCGLAIFMIMIFIFTAIKVM